MQWNDTVMLVEENEHFQSILLFEFMKEWKQWVQFEIFVSCIWRMLLEKVWEQNGWIDLNGATLTCVFITFWRPSNFDEGPFKHRFIMIHNQPEDWQM